MGKESYIDMEREPYKGIDYIASERQEQIEKHGYNDEYDSDHNTRGRKLQAAIHALVTGDSDIWPWENSMFWKIIHKPSIEKWAIIGAFVAAEIDRMVYLENLKGHG